MILVADSGSTKCDWAFIDDENGFDVISTQGFNPRFHSLKVIVDELRKNEQLIKHAHEISTVHYYGAGCRSVELKNIVKHALVEVFTKADILVDHDLTAAIRATCGHHEGIGCILGTGSNLGYFDGVQIHTQESGLGYILGDEGSGTFFGKKLLADFLYHELPDELRKDLIDTFALSRASIMEAVYMKPNANVYLAQFMQVIGQHKDKRYVQELFSYGFGSFIKVSLKRFKRWQEVPVNFVGSVAFYFKEFLEAECLAHGVTLGMVVKRPIENLVEYHKG